MRPKIVAILDHQLESTGRTQPLDRGWVDHEDEGILDARQALTHGDEHGRRIHPGNVLAVKRGQAEENCRCVWCNGAGRHIEPCHRGGVLDAWRLQDDVIHFPDHGIGPSETCAGRQLNDGDEVANVLVGNEAGGHPG